MRPVQLIRFLTRIGSALAELAVGAAWALLLCGAGAGCALLWLDSDAGHDWLAQQITQYSKIRLVGIDGSLFRDPVLIGLSYQREHYRIDADRIALKTQLLPLMQQRVTLEALNIGRLKISLKSLSPDHSPLIAPHQIELPVALDISRIHIAELILENPDLRFTQLSADFHSDGRLHRIGQLEATQAQRKLSAQLTLNGKAPFATVGRFQTVDTRTANPIRISGQFSGNLRQLSVNAQSHELAGAQAQLQLDLFAARPYQILRSGTLEIRDFDPSSWSSAWPRAQLNISLALHPSPIGMASGQLHINNAHPGPLNTNQLPIRHVASQILAQHDQIQLSEMRGLLEKHGTFRGKGQLQADKLALDLQLAGVDLAAFWQQQRPSQLSGSLQLSGAWLSPDIRLNLTDAHSRAKLIADASWVQQGPQRTLQVRQFALHHSDSRIDGQAEINLKTPFAYRVKGAFSGLNPAEFSTLPAGALNGQLSASGQLSPLSAQLDYDIKNSRYNNQAMAGSGKLKLNGTHIDAGEAWLMLGSNRMDIRGSYGRDSDTLHATLDLAKLDELDAQLAGELRGQFTFSGTPQAPVIAGSAQIHALNLPSGLSIGQASLEVKLPHEPDAALQFKIDANSITQGNLRLAQLQLNVEGSQQQHRMTLHGAGEIADRPATLNAQLDGGLRDQTWHGTLDKLEAQLPQTLRLAEAMTLSISKDEVRSQGGIFTLGSGTITAGENQWKTGAWRSNGTWENMAVADVLQWLGKKDIGSDIAFDGRWNLHYAGSLNGELSLQHRSGHDIWGALGIHQNLALHTASAQLHIRHNRADLTAQITSQRFGHLTLKGDTLIDPEKLALAADTPIQLHSEGAFPDLSTLNGIFNADLQLAGSARFQIQHSGTINHPRLQGTILGKDLQISDLANGLNLTQGQVNIALNEDRLILQEATFRGGEGSVRAEGEMSYRGGDTAATARIFARKLTLFSRSDLLLVLSGEGEIKLDRGVLGVSGRLKADQGEIQYRDLDTPRLADDVRIAGNQASPPLRPAQLTLQVDIDLGNDFRFSGYGVDAQLAGLLRLRAQTARPLTANGKVEIISGKYRAYGQRLDIERGILSFQGPIDNPALDVLAMRRNMQVEAGVLVSGNALTPRVQLFSEPSVPDTEKLSWLLFAHGSEDMQNEDAAVMLKAAQSLLGSGGKGLAEEALEKMGIDELGIRTVRESDGSPTRIVSISSQLGKYFRLSVEKSVNDLRDAVSLSFQLGRNWSLITRFTNDDITAGAKYTHYFE